MGRLGHDGREHDLLRLLPLIFLGGAIFGAAECVYHRMGSSPMGSLRADGASYPAFLAIISLAFLVLPTLLALVLRRGGGGRAALMWFVALFPTAWVYADHLVRYSTVPFFHYLHPQQFVVETAIAALVLCVIASGLLWKPSMRWLGARLTPPAGILWLVLLLMASLWLFVFPAPPQTYYGESEDGEAPCILLLSIDTLRADDAASEHAPFLRELATRGVTVEGWAPSPWTRTTFASLFSGVSPTGNGAGKYTTVDPDVDWWPERLARAGWKTKAVVSNPHLERGLGFGRGFIDFDHSSHLERLEPAAQMVWIRWVHHHLQERLDRGDRLVARAVHWLDQQSQDPWFLWVHLIDPHMPYHPRGPEGQLRDSGDTSWLDPLAPYMENGGVRNVNLIRRDAPTMDRETKDALRTIYRREVRFFDRQLRELFEAAKASAGSRELLWVVTSDHGEEFFDHDGFEHGHTLYQELLRVPLLMGGGELPVGKRFGAFRLLDLGPTLLALAGEPPMEPRARGSDSIEPVLAPYVFGEDRSAELIAGADADSCIGPALFAENLLYGTRRTRLFLEDGSSWLRDDEALRFYEVGLGHGEIDDPKQVSADELTPSVRELFDALDRWRVAAARESNLVVDDPALRQRLRTLGYVD